MTLSINSLFSYFYKFFNNFLVKKVKFSNTAKPNKI